MKIILWGVIIGLFSSCSVMKKHTEKKKETRHESVTTQVKEVITEPVVSYIEVPVDCPDTAEKPLPEKTYDIQSGTMHIKAQIKGKVLRIKAENEGHTDKESVIEKIVTVDKIHYRDKVKTVSYIPKWVWALLAFNIIYFTWRYKGLWLKLMH